MALLTQDAILSADDLTRERIDLPEWGDGAFAFVRTLEGNERDMFEESCQGKGDKPNLKNIRAKLVVLTLCDESGKRLFTDMQVNAVGKKSAAVLDRIFGVAQRLNGLTAKDVEDLAKNSEGDPSGDSG